MKSTFVFVLRYVAITLITMCVFYRSFASQDLPDYNRHALTTITEHFPPIVLRGFAQHSLYDQRSTVLLYDVILHKHGDDMLSLWQKYNDWGAIPHHLEGGNTEVIDDSDVTELQNTMARYYLRGSKLTKFERKIAKDIIKSKIKNVHFSLLNIPKNKIVEKCIVAISNGRMYIDKVMNDGRIVGYDLIFEYKFPGDVGFIYTKDITQQHPIVENKRKGAKVLVVIITLYDYLERLKISNNDAGLETRQLKLPVGHDQNLKTIGEIIDEYQDYRPGQGVEVRPPSIDMIVPQLYVDHQGRTGRLKSVFAITDYTIQENGQRNETVDYD